MSFFAVKCWKIFVLCSRLLNGQNVARNTNGLKFTIKFKPWFVFSFLSMKSFFLCISLLLFGKCCVGTLQVRSYLLWSCLKNVHLMLSEILEMKALKFIFTAIKEQISLNLSKCQQNKNFDSHLSMKRSINESNLILLIYEQLTRRETKLIWKARSLVFCFFVALFLQIADLKIEN